METTKLEFDGVIIGAGHNALVLAGYMARAGLRVAVLEKGAFVGGGTGTVPSTFIPGFLHEYHSQFHRNIPATPWFRDLGVADYGVQYIYPPVNNGMPLSDGRALTVHADPEVTAANLARFNKKDAETYLDIYRRYQEMALTIQVAREYAPPIAPDEEEALLRRSKMGREFLALNKRSAYEMVFDLFKDPHVRAFYLFLFSVRGYLPAPTISGTGFAIVAMTYLGNKAMLPRGGSRSLSHALAFMVAAHGGRVFLSTEAARVLVKEGTAVGVEAVDGRVFHAKRFVVSSVDPHQTFLRFLGEQDVGRTIVDRVKEYKYGVAGRSFGVLFAAHAASRVRPEYASAQWEPTINEAFNLCLGYETPEEVLAHLEQVIDGTPPDVIGLQAACPTIHDPARAPRGKHVLLAWQFAPFDLKPGGPAAWDGIKADYLEKVLDRWAEYAPNLARDAENILYSFPQTPADTERSIANMREGDFHVGALIPSQLGANRPFPEVSDYRTPVERLYLTGAPTHPGGNITGAPGYNTAGVVAADLGLDMWWQPRDLRQLWSELP